MSEREVNADHISPCGGGITEIAGCFAFWAWLRLEKPIWFPYTGHRIADQVPRQHGVMLGEHRHDTAGYSEPCDLWMVVAKAALIPSSSPNG